MLSREKVFKDISSRIIKSLLLLPSKPTYSSRLNYSFNKYILNIYYKLDTSGHKDEKKMSKNTFPLLNEYTGTSKRI